MNNFKRGNFLSFGYHAKLQNNLLESISLNPELKTCQLFFGNPRINICRNISSEDKQNVYDYCIENNSTFYIHCPYVTNISVENVKNVENSLNLLRKEIGILFNLPASCVLHTGNGKEAKLENVSKNLNLLISEGTLSKNNYRRVPYYLLLENGAGQGNEIGTSWDNFRKIYEGLDKIEVGICIDTQHAFASGLNKFENYEDIVKLFDEADNIGKDIINLFHLNDSEINFKGKVDRHAPLCCGKIWSKNNDGLISLIGLCKEKEIDLVVESKTPKEDMAIIRKIEYDFFQN